MPGPGQKSKSKSKSKTKNNTGSTANEAESVPPVSFGPIENSRDWQFIVTTLCEMFDIPDITTRSGLKRIHSNFETLCRKLDRAYDSRGSDVRMKGGIVGIYSKMCTDSLLRNKLFDRGLLNKLSPLLNDDFSRQMALQSLVSVTHHGGGSVRASIARETTSTLLYLLDSHPNDTKLAELIIIVISHSVGAVVDGDNSPGYPSILRTLNMKQILSKTVSAMERHSSSHGLVDHGLSLIQLSARYCYSDFDATPHVLSFLVCGLRSNSYVFRANCVGGMMRYHLHGSKEEKRNIDPMKFGEAVSRPWPPKANAIMTAYGPDKSESMNTMKATLNFQKMLMKCAQDHDLVSLGHSLVENILLTEYGVADGYFQDERGKKVDIGLPFTMYRDALPHCAKALRSASSASQSQLDEADILDIKVQIMNQNIPGATALAEKAIARHSKDNKPHGYFYYAISLSGNSTIGLRNAKKGLKCSLPSHSSPFIRFQLLQRSVTHAAVLGLNSLQACPEVGSAQWEEGVAFLASALEDAKLYINEAPPDNRNMGAVAQWFIVLTMMLKGEDGDIGLREVKEALNIVDVTDAILRHMGMEPVPTNLRLTQKTIIELYPAAVEHWGPVISAIKLHKPNETIQKDKAENDLAEWLDDLRGDEDNVMVGGGGYVHDRMRAKGEEGEEELPMTELYRCSWCGNPSAVLRKCAGCSKTRYCDAECQKSHWSSHKKSCKA